MLGFFLLLIHCIKLLQASPLSRFELKIEPYLYLPQILYPDSNSKQSTVAQANRSGERTATSLGAWERRGLGRAAEATCSWAPGGRRRAPGSELQRRIQQIRGRWVGRQRTARTDEGARSSMGDGEGGGCGRDGEAAGGARWGRRRRIHGRGCGRRGGRALGGPGSGFFSGGTGRWHFHRITVRRG